MRKLLLLMLSTAATPAFAADLPNLKSAPAYAPPPPVFSWTSIYIGANVGYVGLNNDITTDPTDAVSAAQIAGFTVPASASPNLEGGITAGGQVGFNYEFPMNGNFGIVAGLEGDYAYTDARGTGAILDGGTSTSNIYQTNLQNLGTARGRIGVAFDRTLVYATGGFAFGRTEYSHSFLDQAGAPIWSGGLNEERTGFAIGAGVEYALPIPTLPGALTIRGEYLHYDLGTETATIPFVAAAGTGIGPFIDHAHIHGNIVRAGLNYQFDLFAPTPVAAKY